MTVQMVGVWHVWMRVPPWFVPVPMAMRPHGHRIVNMVVVPVVVYVRVLVFERTVSVLVHMRFREMQQHPGEHQGAACSHHPARRVITEHEGE